MATTNNFTFQTDGDSLFAAVVQTVQEGGYAVTKVDNVGKKIVYHVDRRGSFGGRFQATIAVTEADPPAAGTATLRMHVAGLHNPATGSAANYRKFEVEVINYVSDRVAKKFQIVASSTYIAPKASKGFNKGRLILFGIIGILAAIVVFGGAKLLDFLKTLIPG